MLLRLWAVSMCILSGTLADGGCRGTLKFQTAPASGYFDETWSPLQGSPFVAFYSNQTTTNVVDCANLCYDDVTFFCNSALYEPRPNGASGICRLSQRALPCLSTETRRKRQWPRQRPQVPQGHQVSTSTDGRLVLFCFRCIETEDRYETSEKVPLATLPPAEIEKEDEPRESSTTTKESVAVENEPRETTTTTESVPVDDAVPEVHEERDFDWQAKPNAFVQAATFKIIPIRIMTFNTWIGGTNVNNGVQKIANHIASSGADIVAVQETNGLVADQVVRHLGFPWAKCRSSYGDSDYILTRHPIVTEYEPSSKLWNTGCRIQISQLPNKYLNMWGVHLDWRDYGPYTACFQRDKRHTDAMYQTLYYNEYKYQNDQTTGRMNNMIGLMNHRPFFRNLQETDSIPLIVAGDFNTPSHLDWTDQMRTLHCNTSYEWPVSKLMLDSAFKDSYRQVYPNPGHSTGFTWTPLHRISPDDPRFLEPQDRIDFIYYRGKYLRATSSRIYRGYGDIKLFPNQRDNDWPSDHAAVITDLEILIT